MKVAGKVYENTLNGHNKFWAISTHGSVMKTTYGKIGIKVWVYPGETFGRKDKFAKAEEADTKATKKK